MLSCTARGGWGAPRSTQNVIDQERLPGVQKWWLVGCIIIVVVFAATFLIIATRNESNAESGPAPVVEMTITDEGFTPDPLVLPNRRLVELRITNDASRRLVVTSDAEGIEQLPVQTDLDDPHAPVAQAQLSITASPGSTMAALVRFADTGTYELRVAGPGLEDTTRILTVLVE